MKKLLIVAMCLFLQGAMYGSFVGRVRADSPATAAKKEFIACLDKDDCDTAIKMVKFHPHLNIFAPARPEDPASENVMEYAIGVAAETRNIKAARVVLAMHDHSLFGWTAGFVNLGATYSEFLKKIYINVETYGDEARFPLVVLRESKAEENLIKAQAARRIATHAEFRHSQSSPFASPVKGQRDFVEFSESASPSGNGAGEIDLYCYDEKL